MVKLKLAMFLAMALIAGRPAFASLEIVSAVGAGPSIYANYVGFDRWSAAPTEFGGFALREGSQTQGIQVNLTPNAKIVTGSVSGQYAAPFISGSNGAMFGDNTISGVNTTSYITTGSTNAMAGAKAELIFGAGQRYLGLLWGSVDLFNTLTFHFDDNTSQSITGAAVNAFANGNQGASGTYYVNINTDRTFNRVVMTSSSFAFEFDNVAYSTSFFNTIPEPGSLLVWGVLGLAGVGLTNRRRQS